MGTYSLAFYTKKIYDSNCTFFALKTLRDILEPEKPSTFFKLVKRLVTEGILVKLEKGKYILQNASVHDFRLANVLYTSSYISFESALNFYGILSQFPYEISSATVGKPLKKNVLGKTFSYVHLKKELFWGYEKKDSFLIASPEKALLDQIYLAAKGVKAINLDEFDYTIVDKKRLSQFVSLFPKSPQFDNRIHSLKSLS